jgi:hypothetical protein
MPRVGFEPMILASKWAKSVHALGHLATHVTILPTYFALILNISYKEHIKNKEFKGAVP